MIVLVLLTFLVISFSFSTKAMEVKKWREDLNYLEKELPKQHKNLFHNLQKDKFHKLMSGLKGDLEKLSELEINLRLIEIFAEIGDSHTSFSYKKYLSDYYPISFKKFGDEYRVMTIRKKYKNLLGAKLVAINGQKIETINDKLSAIIIAENKTTIKYKAQQYFNLPEVLSYCGIISDKAYFTFSTDKGQKTISLEREKIKNMKSNSVSVLQYEPSYVIKNANQLFWYEYFKDKKAIYFQYNSCWSRELEKKYRGNDNPNLPSFEKTTTEIINLINNKQVDKFIVDMRFNSGGSSLQGTRFVNKLKNLNKSFNTYVIIGNRTFSSAIINTLDFRNKLNAVLVGEPTMGKANHYGEVKSFVLPNSKLRISYSTKYFEFLKDKNPDSIYPDYNIRTNFEDFIKGKDTILNKIFNEL